jgi:hypothetical protein
MNDYVKVSLLTGGLIAAGVAVNVIAMTTWANAKPAVSGTNCPESLPHCIGPRGSYSYGGPVNGKVNGRQVHGQFSMTVTKIKKAKKAKKKYKAKYKPKPKYKLAGPIVVKNTTAPATTTATVAQAIVSAPSRFIRGSLRCAANVNAALAARGIRGTGSLLAKSFVRWGRPTTPAPGAVVVFNRGRDRRSGHVAIVSRVANGKVYVWNPSSRKGRWVETVMNRRPIAVRAAA